MGLPAEKRRFTIEEYLRIEEASLDRHEYDDGEIIAMAGGSYEHSLIISSFNRVLGNSLVRKPCSVLDSKLKVSIPSARKFVYPDVFVICGPPHFDSRDLKRQSVTNPRVVVEVLSPTTEAYDRGGKFDRYRQLESFEEYVLVAQNSASVQTFFRQPGGTWLFTPSAGIDAVVKIRCLDVELRLTDIYAGIEFPKTSEAETDQLTEDEG